MIVGSNFFSSSIGRKSLVAITGVGLMGFLTIHMIGNLQMFLGPDAMNQYGVTLRKFPLFLWLIRGGLLLFFAMHVVLAVKLSRENRGARPVRYQFRNTVKATFASRSMIETGLIVLVFLVFHLFHYTFGATHPEISHLTDSQGRHDVYRMVLLSFQQPLLSGTYIIAMFFLALHLSHALPSLFQTMGWNAPRFESLLKRLGLCFAIFLFAGYTSVPVATLLGVIR